MTTKHKDLCDTALLWLYGRGCSVFAKEVPTRNGIADALGIMTRHGQEKVYYIEAKASRSDLICLKQKCVYKRSVSDYGARCTFHETNEQTSLLNKSFKDTHATICPECIERNQNLYDNHIDYYYLIVADGVKVEPELYPEWGVINQKGEVVRKAKRIKRTPNYDPTHYLVNIAHVLVYKAYGKIYQGEFKEANIT